MDELVSGAMKKTYTYGLERISENQLSGSTWTPTFYGYDGHSNVRFTTNTAGTVGNTYQFDAFGMSIASTGTTANNYKENRSAGWISGETSEELLSYPAEGQHDSLVRAFEQGIQQKAASKGEGALTDEERTVLAVRALQREVNNGGFDQFFRNSSRQFAPMIVDSLMRIGCEMTAGIARRATDALHIPTLNVEAIRAVMAKQSGLRDQELELCDQSVL